MGYNTTVVVINDALGLIADDPDFGRRLSEAVRELGMGNGPVDIAAHGKSGGIHVNAATVIETHHADYDVFIRVGKNRGEVVPAPADGE